MPISDVTIILQWSILFFIIGIFFLPFAVKIFSSFIDYGYIFSKIIGIAIVSYIIFLLGITHLAPFTKVNIFVVLLFFATINFVWDKSSIIFIFFKKWRLFVFEELMFVLSLFAWVYVRAHQPDIYGLEKYMDFGFVNSILRADYFPPKDMWFTPFPINYYYFGHLVTAVLTKLSSIPSFITYNLMLSTIFAFTFTASFSIGMNLISIFIQKESEQKLKKGMALLEGLPTARARSLQSKTSGALAGLLTAFLVTLAGNLHTVYTFFKPYVNESPLPIWQLPLSLGAFPNSYWYPNATRFIHNTIHEFPLYSFVVSDLHGHVLDIPFVLLTIAVLFSFMQNVILRSSEESRYRLRFFAFQAQNDISILLLLAFLLAVMYMTNAWDGIIYFLLTILVIIFIGWKSFQKTTSLNIGLLVVLVCIGSILFSLPFSLNFKPFVSGIGVLCAPEFLTKIGKIGPLLLESYHCQKSPLWQLFILYGFFYFWAGIFIVNLFKNLGFNHLNFIKNFKLKIRNLPASDLFILILIALSTLLIIIPEFIYAKDIYPAHYRANTMFKLVYEAFIMLSIASGYIITRIIANIKYPIFPRSGILLRRTNIKFYYWKLIILIIGSIGLFLVMVYPYFAIYSYYGNLQTYYGLDGLKYLKNLYPNDYEAILWLNNNIKGQPVILEAQGDSYTDYARVSANTGLPTVLGWTVHEWLWRGTYDIPAPRISEVQALYENQSLEITKKLIKKYNVSLVFIGNLERQKYPKIFEEKFVRLGKIIYQNTSTKIYKINSL